MPAPLQIFIAYARKDAAYLEELRLHLKPLERSRRAVIWYDGKIEAGTVWEAAIKENLHAAHIILLLVSPDAIASDYFYDKEMTDALLRHEKGEARVVPLILRPCAWRTTPLEKLQALPKDARPVSSWGDRDEAWNDAVEAVLKIIWEREEAARLEIEAELQAVEQEKQRKAAVKKQKDDEDFRFRHLSSSHLSEEQRRFRNANEEKEKKRQELLDPFFGLMVPIKGGTFKMGDEYGDLWKYSQPVHDVTIKDFHLCKHPVTQAQWRSVMGSDPTELYFKGCDNCPVENVSWNDIQDFLKKLNQKTGGNYRLPSEAEWEFAARGGKLSKNYKFSGSDIMDEVGWYKENSYRKTHPVMQKKANELGLYDMNGNVWEWCEDVWLYNYDNAPKDGKAWVSGGDQNSRILRGGSWNDDASRFRPLDRKWTVQNSRSIGMGFRVAQD